MNFLAWESGGIGVAGYAEAQEDETDVFCPKWSHCLAAEAPKVPRSWRDVLLQFICGQQERAVAQAGVPCKPTKAA